MQALHAAYLGVRAGRKEGLLRKEVQGGQPGAGGPLGEHGPPAQLLNSPPAGRSQIHSLEGEQAPPWEVLQGQHSDMACASARRWRFSRKCCSLRLPHQRADSCRLRLSPSPAFSRPASSLTSKALSLTRCTVHCAAPNACSSSPPGCIFRGWATLFLS